MIPNQTAFTAKSPPPLYSSSQQIKFILGSPSNYPLFIKQIFHFLAQKFLQGAAKLTGSQKIAHLAQMQAFKGSYTSAKMTAAWGRSSLKQDLQIPCYNIAKPSAAQKGKDLLVGQALAAKMNLQGPAIQGMLKSGVCVGTSIELIRAFLKKASNPTLSPETLKAVAGRYRTGVDKYAAAVQALYFSALNKNNKRSYSEEEVLAQIQLTLKGVLRYAQKAPDFAGLTEESIDAFFAHIQQNHSLRQIEALQQKVKELFLNMSVDPIGTAAQLEDLDQQIEELVDSCKKASRRERMEAALKDFNLESEGLANLKMALLQFFENFNAASFKKNSKKVENAAFKKAIRAANFRLRMLSQEKEAIERPSLPGEKNFVPLMVKSNAQSIDPYVLPYQFYPSSLEQVKDISNLPDGVYLLQFASGKSGRHQTFLVQGQPSYLFDPNYGLIHCSEGVEKTLLKLLSTYPAPPQKTSKTGDYPNYKISLSLVEKAG